MHADRRPILMARNRIEAALRNYLAGEDFVLVDPPGLQVSPGNETHLHAFATDAIGNDGVPHRMYLHTSPEFSMKKLLAAGEKRIASLGHVWRNRERSALHHPEFTMLEWYRVEEQYDAIIADCIAMVRLAAQATGAKQLRYRGREADPFAEPERLSVIEAFRRHAGIDLLAALATPGQSRKTVGADKGYDQAAFVERARALGLTAQVAQKKKGSAIDGRTTTPPGYAVSQRKRKLVEQNFGWGKTVGLLRKLRHRGQRRIASIFAFTCAAFNLVRLRTLLASPA